MTTSVRSRRRSAPRKGSVMLVVVWAVAIAAVVVAATQILAWRQAVMGREAIARVQARWAARAGVEQMIAIMEYYADHPVKDDAFALVKDLEDHSAGGTETGDFDIRHFRDGVAYAGPMDEHSKLNVNLATKSQLTGIPYLTTDVADAIIDWRDSNDEVESMGAEAEYYANRGFKYRPRNAELRSIGEVELIAGCWPQYVRGEDWNLNGRLDPNEDDGSDSLPPDKNDGYLDAGWSTYLTAYSRGSHRSASGMQKLYLRTAKAQELQERTGLDASQSAALLGWARAGNARMERLLVAPLGSISQQGAGQAGAQGASGSSGRSRRTSGGNRGGTNQPSTPSGSTVTPLSTDQLRAVFQECTLDDPFKPAPGRVNLNTVTSEVLQKAMGLDAKSADAILARRKTRQGGFSSVADLLEVSDLKPETLAQIGGQVDVTSNVFMISSRGRARTTGTEAELVAIVDASTLPVTFIELREP